MINRLEEIYRDKGRSFIEKLFSGPVVITEQTDASAFAVERTGDKLNFYKRESDKPINEVDRAMVRFYEAPISKIERLGQAVHSKMPDGWRFGMEYTYDSEYPLLNLTHIQVRGKNGSIVRTMHDKPTLDQWAKTLRIGGPKIVFEGVIDGDQRNRILDWLYNSGKGKAGFTSFLAETLTGRSNAMPLVLRFGIDGETQLAKVVDHIVEAGAPKTTKVDRGDVYNLTVLEFVNFLVDRGIDRYKPTGRTADQRYLAFMCRAFNDFAGSGRAEQYRNVDFGEPEFMRKPEFDVNIEAVPDQTTRDILKNGQMRRLFKILLAAMRKRKQKESGVMTREVLRHFNAVIDQVKKHVEPQTMEVLAESELPSFREYRQLIRLEDDDKEEPDLEVEIEDVDLEPEFDEIDVAPEPDETETEDPTESEEPTDQVPDNEDRMDVTGLLYTLDSAKDEGEPKKAKKIKEPKKVNVVVGRFQPLHNGHMQMADALHQSNGLPCVLVAVYAGNKGGQSPVSEETLRAMLGATAKKDGTICGYAVVKRGLLDDVVAALRPDYEPVLWGAGADRFNGYLKQAEYNASAGNPLKLSDEFDLFKTERVTSGTSIRKMIEDDDYTSFKSLVPKAVAGMWTLLRRDVFNDKNSRS